MDRGDVTTPTLQNHKMGVVQMFAYATGFDCALCARTEEHEQKIRFYGDRSPWNIAKQDLRIGDDRAIYFFEDAGKSPSWKSKRVWISGEAEFRNPFDFIGISVWLL
jgi:hypothetical protein